MYMNTRIKLKVCGMRQADNILNVGDLLPDYMGFIFYKKSPRYVGDDFKLPENLPLTIKKVGVFVNEKVDNVLHLVNASGIEYVQLHGDETVKECEELKSHNLKIIKVFSVDDEMTFEETKPYIGVVDYFLFDTKGKYYGGNAKRFNWQVLERYHQHVPFFLSGGLNEDNVEEALMLQNMNLHALDINSGVEESPGLKDISKIKAIHKFL